MAQGLGKASDVRASARNYLRRRCTHRIWWKSARIAVGCEPYRDPTPPPARHRTCGIRV